MTSPLPPFQEAGRPNEMDNIEPRVGFAWKVGERTVIRGGTGLYYGDALGADQSFATGNAQIVVIQYANDGRAGFRREPDERATATDLRSGTAAVLLQQRQPARVPHSRSAGVRGTVRFRQPATHLPGIDRLPAPVGQHDVLRSRLRVHARDGTRRMSSRTSTSPTIRRPARTSRPRTVPCVPIPIGVSSR